MINLAQLIETAEAVKPKMGEACNHCGWCCLTEVCDLGIEYGTSMIPCQFLRSYDGEHKCQFAMSGVPQFLKQLAIGNGCDARTQAEAMADLNWVPIEETEQ